MLLNRLLRSPCCSRTQAASRPRWARRCLVSLFLLLHVLPTSDLGAVTFNFDVPPETDPRAIAGFMAAGERWSSVLTDDIQVNIAIAFDQIPSSTGVTILGSTGSAMFVPPPGDTLVPDFFRLRNAIRDDLFSVNDQIAVANLPPGNTLTALTHLRDGTLVLDDDGSGNNTFFQLTTANAKALKLMDPADPRPDAAIRFNSDIAFDFDPSDGVARDTTDFIGVATHEIGHALGFTSGVDLVDIFAAAGPAALDDVNGPALGIGTFEPFALFTALDMYRQSAESLAIGPHVRDLTTTSRDVFFSIDGSPTQVFLETGRFNGSGQQASHFRDGMGIGIMDPTAAPGEMLTITENDLLVLDVIGFDVDPSIFPAAPEPTVWCLSAAALLGGGMLRRRVTWRCRP